MIIPSHGVTFEFQPNCVSGEAMHDELMARVMAFTDEEFLKFKVFHMILVIWLLIMS